MRLTLKSIFSLMLLSIAVLAPASVMAASAVTVDLRRGKVGMCHGEADSWSALSCAQQQCKSAGGGNCQSIAGCPDGGYGAVARDKGKRKIGASCGHPDEGAARAAALGQCRDRGGRANSCEVVEVFRDRTEELPSQQASRSGTSVARVAETPSAEPPAATKTPRSLAQSGEAIGIPGRGGGAFNSPPKKKPEAPAAEREPEPARKQEPKPEPAAASGTGTRKCAADDKDCKAAGSAAKSGSLQPGGTLDSDFVRDVANRLIGKWTTSDCTTNRWEVVKYDHNLFKATFWSSDVGMSGEASFVLQQKADGAVIVWSSLVDAKNGAQYVEHIADVTESSYRVVENNYTNIASGWEVRRCR